MARSNSQINVAIALDTAPLEVMICKNGTAIETAYSLGVASTRPRASCEALVVLAVNDAITFRVSQGNAYAGGGTVANNATASTGSGGGGGPGSGGDPGGTGATGIVFIAYTPS